MEKNYDKKKVERGEETEAAPFREPKCNHRQICDRVKHWIPM